jgi:putative ATP-dependent endonuclease of OLD family
LKQKVEGMGGEFEILRKREIENYYHKDAIQRVLGEEFIVPEGFVIDDYSDMQIEIKEKILINNNHCCPVNF